MTKAVIVKGKGTEERSCPGLSSWELMGQKRPQEQSTLELSLDEWPGIIQTEKEEQNALGVQWQDTWLSDPGQVTNLAWSWPFCEMRWSDQLCGSES